MNTVMYAVTGPRKIMNTGMHTINVTMETVYTGMYHVPMKVMITGIYTATGLNLFVRQHNLVLPSVLGLFRVGDDLGGGGGD